VYSDPKGTTMAAYNSVTWENSAQFAGQAAFDVVLTGGVGGIARGGLTRGSLRRVSTGASLRSAVNSTGCFVAGTEVLSPSGTREIEQIEVGDRVIAVELEEGAAFPDDLEESWVRVDPAKSAKGASRSPRGVCARLARAGRLAMVPAMLAACEPASAAVSLSSDVAVVAVYDARTGTWERGAVGELEVGDEVLHDGHLLRVTAEGLVDRGFAEVGQLSEADATWTVDGVRSIPDGDDWVLVLGDGDEAGHWRLDELVVGERFAFGGRVFESDVVDGDLAVRATGDVLGRVVQTFVRQSDTVIDAEIAYEDGTVEVITGTPEHPFWVPAENDWVPLGELVEGTELHVDSGAGSILVSSTWRQGDFTVYNFEVEGTHNYFVRAPGSDAPAVLVHNTCFGKSFGALRGALGNMGRKEFDQIADKFDKSTFDTLADFLTHKANKHADGDVAKFMRRVDNFSKKGAQRVVKETQHGTRVKWTKKSGEWLMENLDGKVVGYGAN